MAQLSDPGVSVFELPSGVRTLTVLQTLVSAAIGYGGGDAPTGEVADQPQPGSARVWGTCE